MSTERQPPDEPPAPFPPPISTQPLDWLQFSGRTEAPFTDLTSNDANPDEAPTRPVQAIRQGDHRRLPRVAGYEILETLGHGGMGIVYLARQIALNRLVALKMLLDGSHATGAEMARLRSEAALLAQLRHPNIVQIYEVGEFDGRPYCALEFVNGRSLDRLIGFRPQSPRKAAELLATVARAVHAAHKEGIIHRDLKPANILLSADAKLVSPKSDAAALRSSQDLGLWTPKITDFGLAKRLAETGSATRTGEVVGTPNYMAPEQASGQNRAVGPPADIYALGTILYELLTGRPPFMGAAVIETLIRIQSEPPLPPRRLQPAVPRDLETICLTCLRKEPERRFDSAEALADDLDRFLRGEPIRARPTGTVEKCIKWSRRHPGAAAAVLLAVALFFTAFALAGVMVRHNAEMAAERDNARAEQIAAEKARQQTWDALDAMTSQVASDWLATQQQLRPEQERFLRQAIQYYQLLADEAATDEAGRSRVAQGTYQLGQLFDRLGQKKEAETAFVQAQTLSERLAQENPAKQQYRAGAAVAAGALGRLRKDLGQSAAAEADYRRALKINNGLLSEDPSSQRYLSNAARWHHNLGLIFRDRGQASMAEAEILEALPLMKRAVDADSHDPANRLDLANMHQNLGILCKEAGRLDEAETQLRAGLSLREKLCADFPAVADFRHHLAGSINALARIDADRGRWTEAEAGMRKSLAMRQQLAVDFPTVPAYRRDLAGDHMILGTLLRDLGRMPEAEDEYDRSQVLFEKLAAGGQGEPDDRLNLTRVRTHLGVLMRRVGRLADAEAAFRKALGELERLAADVPNAPSYRLELGLAFSNLGVVLYDVKRWPESETALRSALRIDLQLQNDFPAVPVHRQNLARAHNDLGNLLHALGRQAEAEASIHQALTLREQLVSEFPANRDYRLDLAGAHVNHGHALRDGGEPEKSLGCFAKAMSLLEPASADEPLRQTERVFLRNAYMGRAEALGRLGRHAEAVQDLEKALAADPGSSRGYIRMLQTVALARAGSHAQAAAAAEEFAGVSDLPPFIPYELSRAMALAVATVKDDAKLRDQYGARAVALLTQAKDVGFFAEKAKVEQLQKDPDFAPLRSRPDYRKIIEEVSANPKP